LEDQFIQTTLAPTSSPDEVLVSQPVPKLEPLEKSTTVKVIRKMGSSFTPSIKDALAGNALEKKVNDQVQETTYNEYANFADPYTLEQLTEKWNEFLEQIADRPNLCSTLSTVPELIEGNRLLLKVGNSVQEEDVRQIKPELILWLRKELRNSEIELITRLERLETERTHFNDSEKLQILVQKNPNLNELKQIFNLDFKD
jgi:hypothetical protein